MKRAKLGGVEFTVLENEGINDSADVTDNPVESGQDVSDHVKQKPSEISLTGVIVGSNAVAQFMKLKRFKEEGRLLHYIGRESLINTVITNIQRNYDASNKTGFAFDISLKHVRVATAKRMDIKISNPKKPIKTANSPNRGRSYMLQGDKGSDVKRLQQDLNKLGYSLSTDGSYGPATKKAVTQFQKKYKLKIDGSAGTQVFGKIADVLQSKTAKQKIGTKVKTVSNKGKQQTKTKK